MEKNISLENQYITSNKTKRLLLMLGWLICSLGATFYCYEYFLRIFPSIITDQLMGHYHLDAQSLGNLNAFFYYIYVPMQLPVGLLMDRYGPRRLLTLATLACALGTLLFAATPYLIFAIIGRLLIGFGAAFAFVGVLKLATLALPPRVFATFAGLTSGLGAIAAVVGNMLASEILKFFHWQTIACLAAFAGLLLATAIYLFIADSFDAHNHDKSSDKALDWIQLFSGLKVILQNPQTWLVGLIGCLIYLPATLFCELWGVPYLSSVYGLTAKTATIGIGCIFMGYAIGAPIIGFFSDRLQRRKPFLIIGSVLTMFFTGFLLYEHNLNYFELLLLLFIIGVCYSPQALAFSLGKELNPKHLAGTSIATINMFVMLGGMLQPLVGELLDKSWNGSTLHHAHHFTTANYQHSLLIMPVGLGLSFILSLFLRDIKHERHCENALATEAI